MARIPAHSPYLTFVPRPQDLGEEVRQERKPRQERSPASPGPATAERQGRERWPSAVWRAPSCEGPHLQAALDWSYACAHRRRLADADDRCPRGSRRECARARERGREREERRQAAAPVVGGEEADEGKAEPEHHPWGSGNEDQVLVGSPYRCTDPVASAPYHSPFWICRSSCLRDRRRSSTRCERVGKSS